ncbi:MAG: hypothetical protein ACKOTZ_13655 [Chloroflexota bacterium]
MRAPSLGRIRPRLDPGRTVAAALLAAGFLLAGAASVLADAPDPATIDVETDGLTVTVSGSWTWPEQDAPCGPGTRTNRAAGWAADWGDGWTGNVVQSRDAPAGTGFHMGGATDNVVYRSAANGGLGDCGTAIPGGGVTGTWGPLSHTYAEPGSSTLCVVAYDVHYTMVGGVPVPKAARELLAGGPVHNPDNSAQKNYRDGRNGIQCIAADVELRLPEPELTLAKSATESSYDAVGDILHYAFLVTNTGDVPLAGPVSIADDRTTDESCPAVTTVRNHDGILDPGESITCTATRSVTQGDLAAGEVENTATASADGTTSAPDSVTVLADGRPALHLAKAATESTYLLAGDVLHYAFTVRNSGNIRLAGPVSIADDRTSDESCPAVTTVGNHDAWLDPGEELACTATYTTDAADVTAGEVENTATASADGTTSDPDSVTVTATVQVRALGLAKATSDDEFAKTAGETLHFTFRVTNTGNVRLHGPVDVDDPMTTDEACPDVATVGNEDAWLDPGEHVVCTATYVTTQEDVLRGYIENVATASADDTQSPPDEVLVPEAPTFYVLLDQSHSIAPRTTSTIARYNRFLDRWQLRTTKAAYSLTLFNSVRSVDRYVDTPISGAPHLSRRTFRPSGYTPLYDSAARAIRVLHARDPLAPVVFVIFTDGEDNRSTTETRTSLARLIHRMENDHDWRFIYVGTRLGALEAAVAALR